MAGEFGVTLDELRRVSGDLHDVSSAMKRVMSSLHEQLAAAGPAWGGGEMGHQFAEGPNGYLAQLEWVDGSVKAKTGLLDYFSDLLKQVANSFEESDNPGVPSPVADSGPGPSGGGSAPTSGNGMAAPAPAGAVPSIGNGDVPNTGATNGVGSPTEGVGSPANGAASPTGAGGPGGGRGGGAPSGGGEPEAPSQGRTPSQRDSAGEGPGAGEATPGAPVNGDSPGDRVTSGVDAEDDASMRSGTSTPEGMPDSSITPPDDRPFTDGAGSAPPNLPSLPKPPAPPNQSKPRRAGAPDEPAPPSPPKDKRSRRPSGTLKANPDTQRTGSERVRSVAGRAGVADANSTRGEGVARARRRRSDLAQRDGMTGDALADDAIGGAAGHLDRDSEDDGDSHPGDERGLGEDSPRQDDPHRDR